MATGLDDAKSASAGLGPSGVRALKIVIAVMSIMIAAGLLAMIGRLFYLASKPGRATATAASGTPLAPRFSAELPAGASVRTMSLGSDRLAVHYDAPSGSGILVIDLIAGGVSSRVDLVPGPPRN